MAGPEQAPPLASLHIAHSLLSRAHSPGLAETIFTDKVLHRPLKLRPTSPDPGSQDARARRRLQRLRKKEHARRRQKPKPLSAKEKRKLGIYDIPKQAQKYELYVPLHRLWVGYMYEILGLKGESNHVSAHSVGSKLASADFHGAEVEVVRSRCVGRVGCKGIVLKDTKFTFEVITKHNVIKTIPKAHTVFRFQVPQTQPLPDGDVEMAEEAEGSKALADQHPLVFELHGSQFESRAIDRATKKFKQRIMDDL